MSATELAARHGLLAPRPPCDDTTGCGVAASPKADPVQKPSHYRAGGIECIDAIHAALGDDGFIAYCRGNAIKYNWRAPHKGTLAQDLDKAAVYERFARNVAEGRKPREDAR